MPYLIQSRWLSGWADAGWTQTDAGGKEIPLRPDTLDDANRIIDEFIQDTKSAEFQGDMISHVRSDYRAVPYP